MPTLLTWASIIISIAGTVVAIIGTGIAIVALLDLLINRPRITAAFRLGSEVGSNDSFVISVYAAPKSRFARHLPIPSSRRPAVAKGNYKIWLGEANIIAASSRTLYWVSDSRPHGDPCVLAEVYDHPLQETLAPLLEVDSNTGMVLAYDSHGRPVDLVGTGQHDLIAFVYGPSELLTATAVIQVTEHKPFLTVVSAEAFRRLDEDTTREDLAAWRSWREDPERLASNPPCTHQWRR